MSSILSLDGKTPFTSHDHWRLRLGPNTGKEWVYLHTREERAAWPQSDAEKFILGLSLADVTPKQALAPLEAATNAFDFMKCIQSPLGHWDGVCGGQMYLVPMYIIALYLVGRTVPQEEAVEMARYMLVHADPQDGGWGLHGEHCTTVFGTSINYVALRMLGLSPEHSAMVKARNTLHRLGGAVGCPAWGKFWLSLIGAYEWSGNNSMPPEVWLLPKWSPVHPTKWWIFMRAFYIPMSYLYRVRFEVPMADLILELRKEIYVQPYNSIDWPSMRNHVAKIDNLVPHSLFLDSLYLLASWTIETCPFPPLTCRALDAMYEQITMEDENTDGYDLNSVSNLLQMLCRAHAEGNDSEAVQRHIVTLKEFLWMGPDGMQVTVTNGCQVWDTAFIAHALIESGLADREENHEAIVKVLKFLDGEQMNDNPLHYPQDFRQPTKGGWPFSTRRQNGYLVSDCTGEALKSILILSSHLKPEERIPAERLYNSVDLLLSLQASDGGVPSYECERGNKLLESLNPAELYDNIMVEYSYPECTVSVLTALLEFKKHYSYRSKDIDVMVKGAVKYLHKAQFPEGGWIGSWGICFTYGTWFGCQGLSCVGEYYSNSARIRKACHFLIDNQKADGGWGESSQSCRSETYVQHEKTSMAQTSWAAMALMYARYPDKTPVERAVRKVMSCQLPDGSWPSEAATGIGIRTGVMPYPLYKWSLVALFAAVSGSRFGSPSVYSDSDQHVYPGEHVHASVVPALKVLLVASWCGQ